MHPLVRNLRTFIVVLLYFFCTLAFEGILPGFVLAQELTGRPIADSPEDSPAQRYNEAKFYFNQLLTNDAVSSQGESWAKGVQNFRRIYLAAPHSEQAAPCLFMLGQLYSHMFQRFQRMSDLNKSISYYKDTGRQFPQHRLADDSYYAVGQLYLLEKKDPAQAAIQFRKIVQDFPTGDMHPQAEEMLKQLSKEHDIALPSVMIGNSQVNKLNNVLPLKYWSSDNYTRIVIMASGPVKFKEELLQKSGNTPRQLYIDFYDSYIEPKYRAPVPIEDGLLRQIRTGQFSKNTVRVVLDIESIESYKIYSLPNPFRVVIDVRGKSLVQDPKKLIKPSPAETPGIASPADIAAHHTFDTGGNTSAGAGVDTRIVSDKATGTSNATENSGNSKPAAVAGTEKIAARTTTTLADTKPNKTKTMVATASPPPTAEPVILKDQKKTAPKPENTAARTIRSETQPLPESPSISLAQQLGLGVGRIVLDPGHGGKDPGATANGLREKDIVLKLAKQLKPILEREIGCKVLLTRDTDTFISLEERTAIANTKNADLFISLHINAHPSPKVRGVETYYLNLSTNAEAMRVAAMENETSTHQMSDLQDILSDIMKNSKINESSRLAQQVHQTMVAGLSENNFGKVQDLGVKQAPFYVLIGAQMPAILIEIAFISNEADAQNLQSAHFLKALAKEISSGIQSYVSSNTTASL